MRTAGFADPQNPLGSSSFPDLHHGQKASGFA
jgi:hypothetical protein